MSTAPRDYTWPICRGCRHRVVVRVIDNVSGAQTEMYVCAVGLDRDRSPTWCPLYEA